LVSPVALAILRLISATRQPLRDKTAVIVSNNEIFALPIIELMKELGIVGTFVARDSGAIEAKLRAADIIVVAVGKLNFLNKDMVKEGAIVIDVGTNKARSGRLAGDSMKEVKQVAAFKSPVPGGVGPLTVAYLLNNVMKAALMQKMNKNDE
jgi:methylenetetrahydrofolate dehydrogenase (NADP+)/methenyltetrahydrofolate cyclohydrolase